MENAISTLRKVTNSNEVEKVWAESLDFFASDYSMTYVELLKREKTGEKIDNFSELDFLDRARNVCLFMPDEDPDWPSQNIPIWSEMPKEGEMEVVLTYTSHSGNTVLSLLNQGDEWIVHLDLYEGSSFLPHKNCETENCVCEVGKEAKELLPE